MWLRNIRELQFQMDSPSLLLLDIKSHRVAHEYFPLNYGTITALELH